jgi:hypothetical protein
VVWCLGEDKRCASVAGEARGERLRWAGSLEDRAAGQGVVLMLLVRAGEARVPRGQERGARRGKTRVGRTCMWATVGRAGIILAWRVAAKIHVARSRGQRRGLGMTTSTTGGRGPVVRERERRR